MGGGNKRAKESEHESESDHNDEDWVVPYDDSNDEMSDYDDQEADDENDEQYATASKITQRVPAVERPKRTQKATHDDDFICI